MKIISTDEASGLIKRLQNRHHPVRNMLLQLKVGQHVQVERAEWTRKTKGPAVICRDLERKTKLRFDCFELLDRSGWVITRTV